VAQNTAEQEKAIVIAVTQEVAMKVGKGQIMPSQVQEAEEAETEEGGAGPRTTSTQLK